MSTLQDHAGAGDAPTQPELRLGRPRAGGSGPPRRARGRAELVRRRRAKVIRRLVALVLVGLLVPTLLSYYRAVSSPGTDPVSARSVEWLKDNGMSGVVKSVENWWYTHHPPPVGGKLQHGLPHAQALGGSAHAKTKKGGSTPVVPAHLAPPTNMQPLVASPLAGEGVWTPTGRTVEGLPAVSAKVYFHDCNNVGPYIDQWWNQQTSYDSATPVVLGAGERLFGETSDKKSLRLLHTQTLGDGVALLTYEVVRKA